MSQQSNAIDIRRVNLLGSTIGLGYFRPTTRDPTSNQGMIT